MNYIEDLSSKAWLLSPVKIIDGKTSQLESGISQYVG